MEPVTRDAERSHCVLSGEAEAERIGPLVIAVAANNCVDPVLIARIDGIEGLATVIEVELWVPGSGSAGER